MALRLVERDGKRFAECLFSDTQVDETTFFSTEDAGFQFGVMVQPAGHSEPAHFHPTLTTGVLPLSEFIFVQRGQMAISFHTSDGSVFEHLILKPGDAIVLVEGAHSYEAREDLKAIVVKQGPYRFGRKVLVGS